jgi:hypothetical protein
MQSPSNKAPFPRWLAVVIGVAVGVVAAFLVFGATRIAKQATSNQTISTSDGLYAVSIPGIWNKYQTRNPEIVEYISFGTGVTTVRVTTYQPAGDDLDRVTTNVVASSERNLNVSSLHSEPTATTVAGYQARQFEIDDDGHVGFHRFRKTLIATPDGIYDVTTFSRTYNVDRDRTVQDAVLASFHRVGPSAPISH